MLNFASMNIQLVLVLLIFSAALFYIGRMMYRNIFTKKGCGENCKCGVDFSNIDTDKAIK
jgi:hypothetical protein